MSAVDISARILPRQPTPGLNPYPSSGALMHHLLDGAPSPIKVDVKGGDTLEIGFEKTGESTFTNVTLTGPADFVFEGDIEI